MIGPGGRFRAAERPGAGGRRAGRGSRSRGLAVGAALAACWVVCLAAAQAARAQEREDASSDRSRAEELADSLDAPPRAVELGELGRDTVIAAPGEFYRAGAIKRFFFGDLNRDLWEIAFPVPVLDLDAVGGGLEVDELSGGLQTLGLRFESRDGRTFQFRSMVKSAGRWIPPLLKSTPAGDVVQDQMASLMPLSAMVVAELMESAGLLVAKPRPVVMPDDPRLGEYREAFAGRMGWIEERPNEGEGDTPGFAGSQKITGSEALLERLRENPLDYVDQRMLLRARLVDMLVHDTDRHLDQWRWASFDDGPRTRWEPIGRDRDWALARIDGVLPTIARLYSPRYSGFSAERPDPYSLIWNSPRVDRGLLQRLERDTFIEVAREVQADIDDAAIDRAVGVLPEAYLEAIGDELGTALRERRDALVDVAEQYHELLARQVDVLLTDRPESVTIDVEDERTVRVTARAPENDDLVTYERVFHPGETKEIRIYLHGGDDHVLIRGRRDENAPIDLHIVGGGGDDTFVDGTEGDAVAIYDHEGENRFDPGPDTYVTESPDRGQEAPRHPDLIWDTRDWGHQWIPRPELRYDSDLGVYAGFGIVRYGFGFGYEPYHSKYSLSVLSGFAPGQWIGDLEFERPLGLRGWYAGLYVDWFTERPTWFYGLGNETPVVEDETFFRSRRNQVRAWLRGRLVPDSTLELALGPTATIAGGIVGPGTVFDTVSLYGMDPFQQMGLRARLTLDRRDDYDHPRSGAYLRLDGSLYPPLLDVEETFAVTRGEARTYLSAAVPLRPTLHLRLLGERAWGRTPFGDLPFLGGRRSLPGHTERRFVGETAVSGSALLRLRLVPIHVVTDMDLGIHGVGTVGRVWLEDEISNRWHPGFGGGIWLRLLTMERTVSATYVRGRDGASSLYLNLGFPF